MSFQIVINAKTPWHHVPPTGHPRLLNTLVFSYVTKCENRHYSPQQINFPRYDDQTSKSSETRVIIVSMYTMLSGQLQGMGTQLAIDMYASHFCLKKNTTTPSMGITNTTWDAEGATITDGLFVLMSHTVS